MEKLLQKKGGISKPDLIGNSLFPLPNNGKEEYQSYPKVAHLSIISVKSSVGWFPIAPEQIIWWTKLHFLLELRNNLLLL